jgi:cation:H+ antiporter
VLLYFGGEWVVRGAASLALRLGLSPLAVGLTVVSMGTSAPELVVSLDAALGGANDIAVGNVVGSNIANLGLILGLSTMMNGARIQATLVRFDAPLVLLISLLMLSMLYDGVVTRLEGFSFLFGLVTYVAVTVVLGRHESRVVQDEFAAAVPRRPVSLRKSLYWVAAGTTTLALGGHLLVASAVSIASSIGVSQAVIGITLVAVGTSLPEMATSLVAATRGQTDIAVGNLVGSNIFNMLGILGATALIQPLQRGEIGWDSLWVMVAFAAALIPMMYTGLRLTRIEGGILVAGYCSYMIWLILG